MGSRSGSDGNSTRTAVFEDAATIWRRRISKIIKRTDKPEFTTGIPALDNLTHGFRKGELSIVAARTSEGKTSFALQAATMNADQGRTVAYISLEDSREDLIEKIFCNIASVDNQELIRGRISKERLENPTIMTIFENLKLLLLDRFGYNIDEIRHVVEELSPTPDLVFLDYVQVVEKPERMNRYDVLNKFADDARTYSLQSGIGFVLLSQINRAGARDERPSLIHFSGSDTLEQRADKALILFHPYLYEKPTFDFEQGKEAKTGKKVVIRGYEVAPRNWVEVEIAKNKSGIRNVIVPVKFTGRHYRFEEWDGKAEGV